MKLTRSKLSPEKIDRLVEHFVAGTTARVAADIVGVNKNTAILFYHKIRTIITLKLAEETYFLNKFHHQKKFFMKILQQKIPKTSSKINIHFAILQREKKILTLMIQNNFSTVDEPLLLPDAVVYSYYKEENKALNFNKLSCFRLNYPSGSENEKLYPINEIENFWKQTKNHLSKFNGVSQKNLHFFIKEAEWRYNYRKPKILLKLLSSWLQN